MGDWVELDDDLFVKAEAPASPAPGPQEEDLIFLYEIPRETPSFRAPPGPLPNPPPGPQLTLLDEPVKDDVEDVVDWDIEIDDDQPPPDGNTFAEEDHDVMIVSSGRFRHMSEERDIETPMRFSRAPSHFDNFPNFKPRHGTPFEEEFGRLASSQRWTPGSREWTRERSVAVEAELRAHYFSSSAHEARMFKRESTTPQLLRGSQGQRGYVDLDDPKNNPAVSQVLVEPTDEELRLYGFQDLCVEVGIDPPPHTIRACQSRLQGTLVNIVDLVDARRTGRLVEVWTDFDKFRDYTLQPGKMFSCSRAVEDGILEPLLRRIRPPEYGPKRRLTQHAAGSGTRWNGEKETGEKRLVTLDGRIVKRSATRPPKKNTLLLTYDEN